MQNRKKLTLEECLKLKRQPTLQEMVDLSVEDYTKYLYYKGIIKYIPENLADYEPVDEYDGYYPCNDIAFQLKNPYYEEILEEYLNSDDEDELNESNEDEFDSSLYPEWKWCEPIRGIVEANGKKYQYSLGWDASIIIYENDDFMTTDGSDDWNNIRNVGFASYLITNYAEWIKKCKKIEENYKK